MLCYAYGKSLKKTYFCQENFIAVLYDKAVSIQILSLVFPKPYRGLVSATCRYRPSSVVPVNLDDIHLWRLPTLSNLGQLAAMRKRLFSVKSRGPIW